MWVQFHVNKYDTPFTAATAIWRASAPALAGKGTSRTNASARDSASAVCAKTGTASSAANRNAAASESPALHSNNTNDETRNSNSLRRSHHSRVTCCSPARTTSRLGRVAGNCCFNVYRRFHHASQSLRTASRNTAATSGEGLCGPASHGPRRRVSWATPNRSTDRAATKNPSLALALGAPWVLVGRFEPDSGSMFKSDKHVAGLAFTSAVGLLSRPGIIRSGCDGAF